MMSTASSILAAKAVTGEVLGSPGDDAALQLVLKMSGTRLSYRLGGGRQTGAADPAAPADEYAFHQFADAVSRWITCPPSAMTPTCAVYVVSWRSVNSRPAGAAAPSAAGGRRPPQRQRLLSVDRTTGRADALSARALASHISIAPENVLHLRQLDLVFRFTARAGEREEQG